MALPNTAAQYGNITKFSVFSNYTGDEIDIRGGIVAFNYYESVMDNTVRIHVTIADGGVEAGNSNSSAKIEYPQSFTVGEKCFISIEDGYGQQINLVDDYHLRIKNTGNSMSSALTSFYNLNLWSEESIKNYEVSRRVVSKFEGKVSDTILSILQSNLETPKNIYTDPTLNDPVVYGERKKPLARIHELASRSVPDGIQDALGIRAGYLFYENSLGYNFRSIDKLFTQEAVRRLIHNNTTGLPEGYDAKILSYNFNSFIDLESKLLDGSMFESEMLSFNIYNSEYKGEKESEFDATKQTENDEFTGGTDQIKLVSDLNLRATRTDFRTRDVGISNRGTNLTEQLKKSKTDNIDVDTILRQSKSRYNNLFTVSLSITIPGDFGIHCGELVHIALAEQSTSNGVQESDRNSGIYMIVDLCHYIDSNPAVTGMNGNCYTRLNLVRDTFGKKSTT
tara:strand:- start:8235 stop:9587 length:1353 start_codon:yes stop_codon:yes gene_type:complete